MFDLSLTQQVPPSTLAVPEWRESAKQLAAIVSYAFRFEETNVDEAIKTHKTAKELIESIAKSKGIRKFNRKMYERQAEIHQQRITYLEKTKRENGEVVLVPTRDLEPSQGPVATGALPGKGARVEEYVLTHSSDLVDVGVRSFWYHIAKASRPENTVYAIQGITDMDRPMIETLLRRPNEFYPLGGHLHTSLLIQKDGCFKYRMRRRGEEEGKAVWEIPSKETDRKSWSPRTFQFGGRWFVWKEGEEKKGLLKKWGFETLYEMETEGGKIVGEKLFWGKVGGGMGGKWTLFVHEGLSVGLKEHCFASQVSRLMRWKYPPQKDVSGVEKGAAAVSAVGALISLGQLLG